MAISCKPLLRNCILVTGISLQIGKFSLFLFYTGCRIKIIGYETSPWKNKRDSFSNSLYHLVSILNKILTSFSLTFKSKIEQLPLHFNFYRFDLPIWLKIERPSVTQRHHNTFGPCIFRQKVLFWSLYIYFCLCHVRLI